MSGRPVVVIDPEDWEQVERLRQACDTHGRVGGPDDRTSAMQNALRSLMGRSKPEEPTGLGAVVQDAEGTHWIRIQTHYGSPWLYRGATNHPLHKWDDLAVVKVLSQGVTP